MSQDMRQAIDAALAWFEAAGVPATKEGTDWMNEGGWDLEAPRVMEKLRAALSPPLDAKTGDLVERLREAIERITLAVSTREEGVQKEARAANRSAMSDFDFASARKWATVPSIRLDDLQFLLADRTALMARVEEAEKVIEPFAQIAPFFKAWGDDDTADAQTSWSLTIGDFRAAAQFLASKGDGAK